MGQMSVSDIVFIMLPIAVAMVIACLVSFRVLRKEYYWVVVPLAAIATIALLLTA